MMAPKPGMPQTKNILVTGLPGCGKSTLIERILARSARPATGFYTREIREKGKRVGFSITTLSGKTGVLAHVGAGGGPKVGRYTVYLEDLETLAVPAIMPQKKGELVVIDEIGKMECFSPLFREAVVQALDSDHPVIGSIALGGDGFLEKIRNRPDVSLVLVTLENRNRLLETLVIKS